MILYFEVLHVSRSLSFSANQSSLVAIIQVFFLLSRTENIYRSYKKKFLIFKKAVLQDAGGWGKEGANISGSLFQF